MNKKNVVIVGFYIPGIYPPGRDDVVVDLLAPGFLKASADADPELAKKYDISILSPPITANQEELTEEIIDKSPDIICYSVYLWNYNQMARSSRLVKKFLPDSKIVLGGPQVSYIPEETLQENPDVDVIVCGSGEERFKDLLKGDWSFESLIKIPQILFRAEDDNRIVNTGGIFKEDVSKIPSPYKTGAININDGRKHSVMIETFRGCPMPCAYCQWGGPDSKTHRFPLDQILEDIDIIYSNPNIEYMYITDANLFYTPSSHWKPIMDKIASLPSKIPTVATLDIRVFKEGMVEALSKIRLAFDQYHFGMQSTNPSALDLARRKCSDETWRKGIALLKRIDPDAEISLDVIYGLPGDNYEGLRNTVEFALDLKPSKLYLFPLLVLPGTPFWDEREMLGFKLTEKPDYMVRSNNDYSEEDMKKTHSFSVWFQTLQRFPAIRDAILSNKDYNPKKRTVDLIDDFVVNLRRRVDPTIGISFDFTTESDNSFRRKMMNTISEPINCVHVYHAAIETIGSYENDYRTDLDIGLDYYKGLIGGKRMELDSRFIRNSEKKNLDYFKCNWVVAESAHQG